MIKYPIDDDRVIDACKQYFATKGMEFSADDEKYIRILTKLLNKAYNAGSKKEVI